MVRDEPEEDLLSLSFPDKDFPVGASSGQHGTVGRPSYGGDIAHMTPGKGPLTFPIISRHDLDVAGCGDRSKSTSIRMPHCLRGCLRLCLKIAYAAVQSLNEFWLAAGDVVDVELAIGARHRNQGTVGMKCHVLRRFWLFTKIQSLGYIIRVDQLDVKLTILNQSTSSELLGGATYSLATATH